MSCFLNSLAAFDVAKNGPSPCPPHSSASSFSHCGEPLGLDIVLVLRHLRKTVLFKTSVELVTVPETVPFLEDFQYAIGPAEHVEFLPGGYLRESSIKALVFLSPTTISCFATVLRILNVGDKHGLSKTDNEHKVDQVDNGEPLVKDDKPLPVDAKKEWQPTKPRSGP
ncbi:hypothetical protein K438DRAFT_1956989 [Mycena galopus ATCC 62051]|nr:hypothetical protein K438DRAFT_1956989 [Mycena galopus ATCC 62051]